VHLTHFIKQLVSVAATPLVLGLLVCFAGIVVGLCGRRRAAKILWAVAALIVYAATVAPVANGLLAPLEGRYPPLTDISGLPVSDIVVLGSPYQPRDGIPITAALGQDGLVRIAEAVRLMRQVHGARLIVSGGASEDQTASAIGYAKFAIELGVDPDSIVKLDKPLDTAEEARSVFVLLGKSQFVLVTSAYHMPRAMLLMQLAGAHPIAAPTGQLAARQANFGARAWIPTSTSLRRTEHAIHEYIGLAIAN
jgi:uncharacterized SAM-binding protein YcdF (DUF218 family)